MRRIDMKQLLSSALILTISIFITGCKDKISPGTKEVKREVISGLKIENVTPSRVDEYYETSGTIAAKTVSVVASRIMGSVTSLQVKEGDKVSAGRVLLTIDDSDITQRVRAANEGYKEAEKGLEAAKENKNLTDITYQRYKKLFDEKALSGQELDQIETQKRVAEIDYQRVQSSVERVRAGLNEAKVHHGFTKITSPVNGIVTEKKTEVGSMAVPGSPLLIVEDISSYRIEISGDERLAGKIRTGMDATVSIESLNKVINGKITDVVPSVDPMSRSFIVKIAIKGDGLRNGLYGKVTIPIGKKEAIVVPKLAVVEKGQLTGVFTVDKNSVMKYRLVRTGRSYDDKVEIISGLNPDDQVVVQGTERAVDGGLAVTLK
jgi:RND family efflux transporter MFP subunit